jgi:uncharacterized membrane protein YvbJ
MKLKSILVISLLAFLASCTSPESLLKKYEKACESGNKIQAAKLLEEMGEKYSNDADWSEEQMERIEDATVTLSEKVTEDMLNALGAMESLF